VPKSEIRHGRSMQNIVIDMCEKFPNDRLKNHKALILWISDNNNPKNKNREQQRSWPLGTRFRV